jgi:Asp-tRNA(Asn)/Glu-tRNA(Gln) amidotransferase A subunit family amidase
VTPAATTSAAISALSAREIVRRVGAGELTVEAVAKSCIAQIEAREPTLQAWSFFDPDLVLRQARALDKAASKGALHGLPIGIKDVFDTADMPTEMGSPIYKGHRPAIDAASVAEARRAGALILGKTVTAEFAGVAPGPTTNPFDGKRTPGGSSSGSAAAVAAGQCPVAFGTQTGGSIHRPASFCGIVGYKPTYGAISRAGLKLAAETLDTVGLLGRDLDSVELVAAAMLHRAPSEAILPKPRIGLCRTPLWSTAEPATVEAVEDAAVRLAQAGAQVSELKLPADFEALAEARDGINNYERARSMAVEWANHADQISPKLAEIVRKGQAMGYDEYLKAATATAHCRALLNKLIADYDILLAPCVPGEAPEGLGWTGDTRFQSFWTMLHAPSMSLPMHKGPHGLPISIQLIAPLWQDAKLFAASRWVADALGASPR